MDRHEFIPRIAVAILAGKRKSGGRSDPSIATAYATHVADNCQGCSGAGIHKIGAEFSVGIGTAQRIKAEMEEDT
jgi:hypothetical protein